MQAHMCVHMHAYACAVKAPGRGNLLIVVVTVDVNKNASRTYRPILLKASKPHRVRQDSHRGPGEQVADKTNSPPGSHREREQSSEFKENYAGVAWNRQRGDPQRGLSWHHPRSSSFLQDRSLRLPFVPWLFPHPCPVISFTNGKSFSKVLQKYAELSSSPKTNQFFGGGWGLDYSEGETVPT